MKQPRRDRRLAWGKCSTQLWVSFRCRGAQLPAVQERTPVSIAFGTVLRRSRERAERSQAAIAEHAGVHPNYVSLLERGLRVPSLDVFLRLAGALSVGAPTLIRLVEDELTAKE